MELFHASNWRKRWLIGPYKKWYYNCILQTHNHQPNKTMNRIFSALLLLTISIVACKSKDKTTTTNTSKNTPATTVNTSDINTPNKAAPRPEEPYWELQRTGCYGTCPIYKLQIYGNGNAIYEAGRFSKVKPKLGIYEKQLSRETINDLVKTFEEAKFWELQNEYTDNVSDLPTTYITFKNNGKSKRITDYYNTPAQLKRLEEILDAIIASEEGWVLTKETPSDN